MSNFFGTVIGVIIIVAGLALIWTPIPVGALLLLLGLSLLAASSQWARERIRAYRSRHRDLDGAARVVERGLPKPARRAWEATDPKVRGDARASAPARLREARHAQR